MCGHRPRLSVRDVVSTCMLENIQIFIVQKTHLYVQRDAYMWKETYMCGNRPRSSVCDVVSTCMHESMKRLKVSVYSQLHL